MNSSTLETDCAPRATDHAAQAYVYPDGPPFTPARAVLLLIEWRTVAPFQSKIYHLPSEQNGNRMPAVTATFSGVFE